MDGIFEEKTPEQSDEDSLVLHEKSNTFMHQVRLSRKNSFSYNNEQSDSPLRTVDDVNNSYIHDAIDEYKSDQPLKPSFLSSQSAIIYLKRQHRHTFMDKPTKLARRHSADKILCKASHKNINSRDYLNRMVITLRYKIATCKEDLRIAGELGQNLFSQNGQKDLTIQRYEDDIHKLRAENDEISNVKNQLLQTTKLDAELAQRLEKDLHHQKSCHMQSKSKYQEECVVLQEQLERSVSDVRHLQQLRERQRIEIQTLETRNEQISVNAGETIDDLSRELAEEKDGHSNLKHKYQKLHSQFTKLKINYEKRGTGIKNLKRKIQENELKMLSVSGDNMNGSDVSSVSKQQMRLLYRQIDNYKDEIEGMQKHVDLTKSYLKTTMNYLENTGLLMKAPDIQQIYTLCHNARQFLGIHKPPPDPVYEDSPEAPEFPQERSAEPLPSDDDTTSPPAMPREPTPELIVSQRQHLPISVPPVPPNPSPPPPIPPSIPQQPSLPQSPPLPPPKISHTPSFPPSLPPSQPRQPQKTSLPLPPPPHSHTAPKLHHVPTMPAAVHISPSLPAPTMPTHSDTAPSLPTEVMPKTKRFSSAMQPEILSNSKRILPPPQPTNIPRLPPLPNEPRFNSKLKISAPAMVPTAPCMPPPARSECNIPMPSHREHIPRAKTHNLGVLPAQIVDEKPVPLSVPIPHAVHYDIAPTLPQETAPAPQSKVIHSAMVPPKAASKRMLPPPKPLHVPHIPSLPHEPSLEVKISAQSMLPSLPTMSPAMAPPAPRQCRSVPLPLQREQIPAVKTHNLGVMPAVVVDEKPFSVPCAPSHSYDYSVPLLPQQARTKSKVVNAAMVPPSFPPSMPPQSQYNTAPAPRAQNRKKRKMESAQTKVQSNNASRPKKKKAVKKQKKKSKKPKKERDSMEEQKQHLSIFFSTYSDNKNWAEGGKENGVQKYILKFAEREPLNARMAFLYSMTLYLGQIVGVNKRCITHAFMLFKSVRAQIDTLCEEFALILQTLEHHNDDKLWKYVYSFLYNAAAYFKHIQRFVGTRTSVDNPRKYSRSLKDGSRDFSVTSRNSNANRRESSFRKLSGLSEVSGASPFVGHYNNDNDHRIYGSIGKKKKSSYA